MLLKVRPHQAAVIALASALCSLPLYAVEAPVSAPAKMFRQDPVELRDKSARSALLPGETTEPITIRRAIEMALENNLEVKFERIGIDVEGARVRFAVGAFDSVFSLQATRQQIRREEDINNPRSADTIRQQESLLLQQAGLSIQQQALFQAQQALNLQNAINIQNTQAQLAQANLVNALQGQDPISLTNPEAVTVIDQPLPIDLTLPRTTNIIRLNQRVDQYAMSLQGRTPIGTRYGFEVSVNRSRNTFVGDPDEIIPLYESFAGITVVQPLLRNFGTDANLADLRIARLTKRTQALEWKQSVATAIQGVMSTYYDMLYAYRNIQVREDAIAADAKLVDLYRRRVDLGFGSPIDIRQAEVAVSTNREALLLARNAFMERQFALKRLIFSEFQLEDARVFVPENAPLLPVPSVDRSAFMRMAFEKRWDYRASLLSAESQEIRLKFARDQVLPQLDLVATYGLNGLDTGLGGSIDRALSRNTPQWSIGLQFQVPLGNIEARAQLDAVRGQREQAILRIKQSELTVGVDVDTVISRLITNQQRVETARQTRELGEETVRIAYRRLEEGLISAYDIIDQQRQLYEAKSRELIALAELNKSVTQLWLVTGAVLEKQGIGFQEPREDTRPARR